MQRVYASDGDAVRKIKPTRRNVLAGALASIAGLFGARPTRAADLTPPATEGPFYPTPTMRLADVDNDLVKIAGRVREAGGEAFTLKGRVIDKNGAPREGVRVEIWQCDLNGKYFHPGDAGRIAHDEGFQGFGHDLTGPDGAYSFRTIKPGKYPGRTEHIHVKVLDGSRELLTTQFYEAGNANNRNDGIYRRLSESQRDMVSMVYETGPNGDTSTVDIIV